MKRSWFSVAVMATCIGACDAEPEGPREIGAFERMAAPTEGLRILATVELYGPAQRVGGGAWISVANADGAAPELVHLLAIDPAGAKIDLYPDFTHELHCISGPLSDEQVGAIMSASDSGEALHLISETALVTQPGNVVQVRFSAVDAVTDEIVYLGQVPIVRT